MHELLSLHYEGTWFSPYADVGAGAEHSPYRWNGLTWEYEGREYVNERVVGSPCTATLTLTLTLSLALTLTRTLTQP